MILDAHGRPLRRAIGFVGGLVPVRKTQALVDALYVVGVSIAEEEDEEERDAAPTE